jgi:hypothetical protein
MDTVGSNLMIDPSLLLSWSTYRNTIYHVSEFAQELRDGRVFVPRSFLHVVTQQRAELPWFYWFFAGAETPTAPDRITAEVAHLEKLLIPYEVSSEQLSKYDVFSRHLRKNMRSSGVYSDLLPQVILEEWVFLQEESWISARIRAAFDKMIEAGGTCVELGQNAFDKVVRKTLKRDNDEELDRYDRMRAIGKWLAAGGVPALSLANPLAGALAGVGAGLFLLVDPE